MVFHFVIKMMAKFFEHKMETVLLWYVTSVHYQKFMHYWVYILN